MRQQSLVYEEATASQRQGSRRPIQSVADSTSAHGALVSPEVSDVRTLKEMAV